ncbi:MAG: HAD-IA family hydrolase [Pseudomonadota bacterium]
MRPSIRDDLLRQALMIFDRDGFHGTTMDRLVELTGFSKTSMYNHFASKEDLVLAVLTLRDLQFRSWLFGRMRATGDSPQEQLLGLFDALAEWFVELDFRGCLFVKAMAEFQDPNHAVHIQAKTHKAAVLGHLTGLASAAGTGNAESLARRLLMLMEGAVISAQQRATEDRARVAMEAKGMAAYLWAKENEAVGRGTIDEATIPKQAVHLLPLVKSQEDGSATVTGSSLLSRSAGPPLEKPRALLFDLGGVIVDVDFNRAFDLWAQHADGNPSSIKQAFSQDHAYDTYERGEISANAYFAHLRGTLEIGISNSQFLEGWNGALSGLIPGVREILAQLVGQVPLFAFSNTNRAHVRTWPFVLEEVFHYFDVIYASSSIGLRKPDSAAFDHVVTDMGLRPDQVVFFDDLQENVDGALACGLRAYCVPTTGDLIKALHDVGLKLK